MTQVARRRRPDIGRRDMILAIRYQYDIIKPDIGRYRQTWYHSDIVIRYHSDVKIWYRSDIVIMILFRHRHYDIIPIWIYNKNRISVISYCNSMPISVAPRLVSDIVMISEWYQFAMSKGWYRADIGFQYQLPISKIDIVMISWILISADIGFMSADMIRYVGYRLATRDTLRAYACTFRKCSSN